MTVVESPVALSAVPLMSGVVSLVADPSAGAVRVTVGGNFVAVAKDAAAIRGGRGERRLRALHRSGGRQEGGEQDDEPGHADCGRPSGVESRHRPASALSAMSSAGRPMMSMRTFFSLSTARP